MILNALLEFEHLDHVNINYLSPNCVEEKSMANLKIYTNKFQGNLTLNPPLK